MFLFRVQMQACYCFLEAHGRLTPCRQRLLEQGSCVSLVPHTSPAENDWQSVLARSANGAGRKKPRWACGSPMVVCGRQANKPDDSE